MSVKKRTSYTREEYYGKVSPVSFGVNKHKVSLYVEAFVADRELRGLASATITP